jgi:hypothetical protein
VTGISEYSLKTRLLAGAQSQWFTALQGLSGGAMVQCLVVAAAMTVGCILLNGLKHYVPLVSNRIGETETNSSQEPPRLPIILCPNSTLVCTLSASFTLLWHISAVFS